MSEPRPHVQSLSSPRRVPWRWNGSARGGRPHPLAWCEPLGTGHSTLTWISLPFGLVAAVLLASLPLVPGGWMLLGAFVCHLGGNAPRWSRWFARSGHESGRVGDGFLDHLDRVLDILWIVAIASNAAWFSTP